MNDLNSSDKKERPGSMKRHPSTNAKSNYADALGFHQNILDELIDKDIVDDTRDPQLNRYMVDSKLFNPKLFLSVIHSDKSLNDLMLGIHNLEKDIEAKKPLLQQLITNNFEKTLSSKNSLDKVFNEFSSSNLGQEIDTLNQNLAYSNNSANQLLNPVLLLISKEQELANALTFINQNKFFMDLPKKLKSYIDEDDFDSLLKEYERGFAFFQSLKTLQNHNPLFDKIWSNVVKVINDYKISMTEDLKKIHIESINSNFKLQANNSRKSNFVSIIKRMIELNATKSPIKDFVSLQYDYILEDLDTGLAKINYTRLFNARNSILNAYPSNQEPDSEILLVTTMKRLFTTFGSSTFNDEQIDEIYEKLDFPLIVQLWTFTSDYINDVTELVIGKKILKFESIVEYFLTDFDSLLSKKAKSNPNTFKTNEKDLALMRNYFNSMVSKICARLQFFFSCTTSDLTNALQLSMDHGATAVLPPPGTPDLNDPSTFGFLPPNTNSISAICFSVNLHNMIYKKLSEVQNKALILNSGELNSTVTSTIFTINQNLILGCLSTLNADIKKIFYADNMSPSDTIDGATKLITFLQNYYKVFISKLHQIHIFDNKDLMKLIKQQFLSSFDVLLNGMVQNVARQSKIDPTRSDYYYLATIYDMRNLTQKIIPSILRSFDINFQSNLSKDKDLKIYESFDTYEYALFAEYMKEPLTAIKQIVGNGITDINTNSDGLLTRLASGEVIEVSPYILKAINHINSLKSRLLNFKIRNSFILDVQSSLIGQLQKKIVDNLSIDFTEDGLYQIVLDINLLLVLLKKYNTRCPELNIADTKRLEQIYQKLKPQADVSSVEKNREANINFNYAQFVCFITC
ncbi:hypothetical protein PMKS-000235 [Pichia membranifaciens]|uniref:Exocyst complex component SEC5 n=1 Tax=Pichia membranifaciens TaxID=4926 RepID=A0A1Q2YB69_9ASCO|nr:hypothetical protein PMKS-000235 [Pichia membranifaciens]